MFIWDYMEETEEEVFAKGEAIGLTKGETIGDIKGTIRTYLKFCSKDETIKNVMNEFHLSREEVLKIIDSFNNK